MSILVTGGTGYLGSYLVRRLVHLGEDVVVFDAFPKVDRIADIVGKVTVVVGDVTQLPEILDVIDRHGVDRIVHMAYVLAAGLNMAPGRGIGVNVDGTLNIFEAARFAKIRRVVYGSSVTQYGIRQTFDEDELDEDDIPRPSGSPLLYGACKQFNERVAEFYTREFGLELIGMRPTSIYGLGRGQRRQGVNNHFMVLPEFAALGDAVVMPPDEMMLDWMYAEDAAYALLLALTRPLPTHRVFNMRSQRARHGEITRIVRGYLPDADISVGQTPPSSLHLVSNRRLRDELGFEPQYSLEAGFHDYLGLVRARAGLPPLEAEPPAMPETPWRS